MEAEPMTTKEKIIDAAMQIVRDQGVARLTVEQAAKVAGISKGGVLYHFRSKDDLVGGMVQCLIDMVEAQHLAFYQAEPEGPYRWARAFLNASYAPNGPCDAKLGGALLAAMTINPDLMAPLQAKYDEWAAKMRHDSPDIGRAMLVGMAMDGMFFAQILGLSTGTPEEREKARAAALALLK